MARVLVTGAAGFLGRRVVERFAAGRHAVRAMVLHPRETQDFPEGVEVVSADLLSRPALAAAVAGVEIACHCAARLPGTGSPGEIAAVNAQGTAHLVEALVAAGGRRLVYVSTDSVYGDGHSPGATEDAPIDPGYLLEGNYPRTKLEGESAAWRASADHGLAVTVLRPCFIYGPGDSAGTRQLRHMAARRVHVLLGGGRARLSMAYVTDVAEAVYLAATVPEAIGRTYNVSSGEPTSLAELSRLVSVAAGRRRLRVGVPAWAVLPAARALAPLLSRMAPRLAQRVDPRRLAFTLADHCVDIGRIRGEIGFAPRVGVAEGLRRTFAR